MTIRIDGIIGWDVIPSQFRAELAEQGDTAHIEINSPGGDVHDGIDISNALRSFRRNGGTVTASITGVCASMATYIAMHADSLEVEDNAVFMVHNPWSIAIGDHRSMRKSADILESLQSVLGRAYAAKTGRSLDEITAEMDDETWLFGAEIVEAGYADSIVPAGDGAEDRATAMALAQTAFSAMRGKLKERADESAPLEKIAAMLPQQPSAQSDDTDEVDEMNKPGDSAAQEQQPTESAGLDADAIRVAAIAAERERVSAITALCAKTGMQSLTQDLISSDATIDQSRARIIDEWVAKGGPEIRNAQPQNNGAADIDTAALRRKLMAQVSGRSA